HGHADDLLELLETMGYRQTRGVFQHPDRKVIFLGDFIDRGPKIRQVLEIVRPMVESGHALAVMGNHELNALAYHTENSHSPGHYLRPRESKNEKQHRATLQQLEPDELRSYLDWFRTLPLWLDLEGLRVVHACWDESALRQVADGYENHGGITTEFLHSACLEGEPLFAPVEMMLKGKEGKLPSGVSFLDKDGHERRNIRTRWYLSPEGHTYGSYALQADPIPCDVKLQESVVAAASPYPAAAKPVFVGHYWLWAERPKLLADNVACLDFSVAKGGYLCAYRWNGEKKLTNEHFVRTRIDDRG
ncbi:MAG: metallophosphoesterase, partial [Gemmataceae bacterium]